MVCSRQSIGWGGLWRSCCPSCQIFGAVRFEPKRSFLDSPWERRCSCAVDFWHIVVKPRRRKTTQTYYRFWKSRWNNELRCIGFGWLRSPVSINQESEDNIELLPLYHVPCVTLCTLSLSCQTTLTKRKKKKKKKKDCQMSVCHKADPGELIQWVTHESRLSAASNSGLIRIGTQPRTADAWHQWLMPAARRRHPRFFGHFDCLFDRLPVRISTSDLYHWILRKKNLSYQSLWFWSAVFLYKLFLRTVLRTVFKNCFYVQMLTLPILKRIDAFWWVTGSFYQLNLNKVKCAVLWHGQYTKINVLSCHMASIQS